MLEYKKNENLKKKKDKLKSWCGIYIFFFGYKIYIILTMHFTRFFAFNEFKYILFNIVEE